MAKYTSLAALFKAIADAIRGKTGGTDTIVADDFPKAIEGIASGGGGCDYEFPHTFMFFGKCYLFLPGQTWDDWMFVAGGSQSQGNDMIPFYGSVAPTWAVGTDEAGYDIAEVLIYPDTGYTVSQWDEIQPITYGLTDWYDDL